MVVALQRDDRTGLVWPGWWDLPGGGREGDETPLDCALRETLEEVTLSLSARDITWSRAFADPAGRRVWFFTARPQTLDPTSLRLGEEGQDMALMPLDRFLNHPRVIPHFRARLACALAEGA